jgi:transcriptional regulator with XRE-family HTH domain
MAIGRRVRELRQQLQISQEELAERADLHRNYVGSVERGERDAGITAIDQLAGALSVSLADFIATAPRLTPLSGARWAKLMERRGAGHATTSGSTGPAAMPEARTSLNLPTCRRRQARTRQLGLRRCCVVRVVNA